MGSFRGGGRGGRRWRVGGYGGGSSGYPTGAETDWGLYVDAGGDAITSFNGRWKFLSNFSWSDLDFEGARYPSVEHAFQAAKLRSNSQRRAHGFFEASLTFGEAKRLGRNVPLREDWKEIREDVMARCLAAKFEEPGLRAKLVGTASRQLIDGHSGSPDLIWGYHFPSRAGENRLGVLLMELRAKLQSSVGESRDSTSRAEAIVGEAALFHLDWPMKCLHDGLPQAYADRIAELARRHGLAGCLAILPRQQICIALRGSSAALDAWEHQLRTENVDVNSRGRPCRERMLVRLLRTAAEARAPPAAAAPEPFCRREAESWSELLDLLAAALLLPRASVDPALGPEPPELPRAVRYADNRTAVVLDGKRFALCLNDDEAARSTEALLGDPVRQQPRGRGEEVPLGGGGAGGKPSIFGGRFARVLPGLLDAHECKQLIDFSERIGYGLAGSRGFNPFARYALRCIVDWPEVAAALTRRLVELLPAEYPPGSGRPLVGVNERCRFLKYHPGMHHAGDHTDCAHEDPARGRSFLTVQLYLNEGFRGGRTTFISDSLVPVEPSPGCAVVFDHELYHRGGRVTEGIKYAVRLDVLYGHAGGRDGEDRAAGDLGGPCRRVELRAGGEGRRGGRWNRR